MSLEKCYRLYDWTKFLTGSVATNMASISSVTFENFPEVVT